MMRPAVFSNRSAHPWRLRAVRVLCLLTVCALLDACGGGMVAGVGSGGSGVAEGTLSGFGSVIVDGIEYSESALPADARSILRLGQRVRLIFGSDGGAQSIEVRPQLRGPVTAALDADGWLRVAGQWVRVVDKTDDSTRSGITLLDGFDGGSVSTGQDAVAYGSWVWDNSKASHVLVATRLEKLSIESDPILLGGLAAGAQGTSLRLNSEDGTQVSAARLPPLPDGTVVAVLVSRAAAQAALTPQGTIAAVQALEVRNDSLAAIDLGPYQTIRLAGLANGYDGAAGTVSIQGTQLRLDMAAPNLENGQFVRATSGSGLSAATVQPRTGSPVGRPGDDGTGIVTQLKGLISGVNWSATNVQFVLRGVGVQAEAAQISASCRAAPSSQTLYVEVNGYTPSPTAPVRANSITCSSDLGAAQDL